MAFVAPGKCQESGPSWDDDHLSSIENMLQLKSIASCVFNVGSAVST